MRLRDLDDATVPVAARHLDRFVSAWRSRVLRVQAVVAGLRPAPFRVRHRRGGRAVPAAAAAILVITLAGAGAAAYLASQPTPTPAPSSYSAGVLVGPRVGEQVAAYRSTAARDLARAAKTGRGVYALVDLTRYLTVAQAVADFSRYRVLRVYLQPPRHARLQNPHAVDVRSLAVDVPRAMSAVASERRREAAAFALLAKRFSGQAKLRKYYDDQAKAANAEARAMAANCACIFALVVQEPPERLGQLAFQPDVRVVDAPPKPVPLSRIAFVPLPPEVRSVVPVLPPALPTIRYG